MRVRGFTLIEVLVALAIMALMATLSWQGLDGMVRTQHQVAARSDTVATVQAALEQWGSDLDAVVQLPQAPALDWDGRALRMTRSNGADPAAGLLVVAWSVRNVNGAGLWLRWQSPPLRTRAALQAAWADAALWAQNPGAEEKKYEVALLPVAQWQVYYNRSHAWTNPLSSSDVAAPIPLAASSAASAPVLPTAAPLPDGVRLVLTLPEGPTLSGTLTRDWLNPSVGGGKS